MRSGHVRNGRQGVQLDLFDWRPRNPAREADLRRCLVVLGRVAHRVHPRGTLSVEDLVQEAMVAVVRLYDAGRFDPRRGTLAGWASVNGLKWMRRHAHRQGRDVHASDHAHQAERAQVGTSRGASETVVALARGIRALVAVPLDEGVMGVADITGRNRQEVEEEEDLCL